MKTTSTIDKQFTVAQKCAIESTGITLCVAGPGSGKTAVSVAYIVHKIASGQFDPTQVLAVTFGRKARTELRARLADELDAVAAGRVSVLTLHAMCKQIVTQYRDWLGFNAEKPLAVVSAGEKEGLLKRALSEVKALLEKEGPKDQAQVLVQMELPAVAHEISLYKAAGTLPEDARPIGPRATAIVMVYARLQALLRERSKADFDDLQMLARKAVTGNAEARDYFRATWPVVVIDEAQDVSEVQFAVLQELITDASQVLVVGDAHQTVYGFRGALGGDVFNRLQSGHAHAKVIVLPDNHRNAREIMETGEALLELPRPRQVARRQGGVVSLVRTGSGYEEALFIAGQIAQIIESGMATHGQIAVLCRTNDMVSGIERVLMELKVPYAIAGSGSFFEQSEIEQLLAYLRLTQDASDAHAMRQIANAPERGLKRAELEHLRGDTPELLVEHVFDDARCASLDEHVRDGVDGLRNVLLALCELKNAQPAQAIQFVMDQIGYAKHIARAKDAAAKLARVQQLTRMAGEFTDTQEFLEDCELMAGEDPLAPGASERVQLMSLHRSKGLEFKVVFIPGVEENLLPLATAHQTRAGAAEERRLFYVGITRAEQAAVMSYARTRNGAPALPSSFLSSLGNRNLGIKRCAPAWADIVR
jgi:DNA helicase-2/ATP-dependent DNA helicase PcrA